MPSPVIKTKEDLFRWTVFPSDDLSIGDIRRVYNNSVTVDSAPLPGVEDLNGYDPKLPKEFTALLVAERSLVESFWLAAKNGEGFIEPGQTETVAQTIDRNTQELRPLYEKFGICDGQATFEQKIRGMQKSAASKVNQVG